MQDTSSITLLPLVYSSCPQYRPLAKGFFHFWSKYFPTHHGAVFATDSRVDIPVENNRVWRLSERFEKASFSTRLLETLRHINSEIILFALDDFWLSEPVNEDLLCRALYSIQHDRRIAYINLWEVLPGSKNMDGLPIAFLSRKTDYRVSTQLGLWRVSSLKKLLRRGESAWLFEVFGTKRSRITNQLFARLSEESGPCFRYNVGGVVWRGGFNEAGCAQACSQGLEDVLDAFPRDVKKSPRIHSGFGRFFRGCYRYVYLAISAVLPAPYLLGE